MPHTQKFGQARVRVRRSVTGSQQVVMQTRTSGLGSPCEPRPLRQLRVGDVTTFVPVNEKVADFLQRRARAPIKAVLLMQERFPGIGNWMADEILWRAAIHPARTLPASRAATTSRSPRQAAPQIMLMMRV